MGALQIDKIILENYRLLKKFSIDLEEELSLVVGKNNTGKTSILLALEKFLNSPEINRFSFDDFNVDCKNELRDLIEDCSYKPEEDFLLGIKLKIFIKYDNNDNLLNVSKVMMDLDPDNNDIVLGFEYTLNFDDFQRLKTSYKDYKIKEDIKVKEKNGYKARSLYDFLEKKHSVNTIA